MRAIWLLLPLLAIPVFLLLQSTPEPVWHRTSTGLQQYVFSAGVWTTSGSEYPFPQFFGARSVCGRVYFSQILRDVNGWYYIRVCSVPDISNASNPVCTPPLYWLSGLPTSMSADFACIDGNVYMLSAISNRFFLFILSPDLSTHRLDHVYTPTRVQNVPAVYVRFDGSVFHIAYAGSPQGNVGLIQHFTYNPDQNIWRIGASCATTFGTYWGTSAYYSPRTPGYIYVCFHDSSSFGTCLQVPVPNALTGYCSSAATISSGYGSYDPVVYYVGDIDGDGIADIVYRKPSGAYAYRPTDSTGRVAGTEQPILNGFPPPPVYEFNRFYSPLIPTSLSLSIS